MSAKLADFYDSLRWEGWVSEVKELTADQTINIVPFLFLKGPPIGQRSRRAVPVAEQYAVQLDMQQQLAE
jgi:hypothetical protein